MIISYAFGIIIFLRIRAQPLVKMLILIMLIEPIPASLKKDPFYTLRTLVFLWSATLMIGFGINAILNKLSANFFKFSFISILLIYSIFSLYTSYFILFKYERMSDDYSYMKLLEEIDKWSEKKFVVDNSRHIGLGIRFAFFQNFDPGILQQQFKSADYYRTASLAESFNLDNIEIKQIDWAEVDCWDLILVGDLLAVSDEQAKNHNLTPFFDIKDIAGNVTIKAFKTNPNSCNINE